MKASAGVEHELELVRSRTLTNLEEGRNLLNRMRHRSPARAEELVRMRARYAEAQAARTEPAERLRSILDEDRVVYLWNYSVVLLSSRGKEPHSAPGGALTDAELDRARALSLRALSLYVKGKLRAAEDLVMQVIGRLEA